MDNAGHTTDQGPVGDIHISPTISNAGRGAHEAVGADHGRSG